jgi:hypothetical protein
VRIATVAKLPQEEADSGDLAVSVREGAGVESGAGTERLCTQPQPLPGDGEPPFPQQQQQLAPRPQQPHRRTAALPWQQAGTARLARQRGQEVAASLPLAGIVCVR